MRRVGDRGSMSVFLIGSFLVGLLLVGACVDLATIELSRRTLQARADAAALAGAQAADVRTIYTHGVGSYLPVDRTLARSRVRTLLAGPQTGLVAPHLDSVTVTTRTVEVRLSARIRPPFLRLLGTSLRIDARARATHVVE